MLAAMTYPSRVLNLDIKTEAFFFMPKSYIYIYREVLKLETSVFESFTVANSPYRPCG